MELKLEDDHKHLGRCIPCSQIGRINIDKKEGLKLAQNVGVLDNGIPNIQLMKGKTQDITIMRGIDELFDEQKLLSTINLNLKKMQSLGNGDLYIRE